MCIEDLSLNVTVSFLSFFCLFSSLTRISGCPISCYYLHSPSVSLHQVIQTIRAADLDNFANGKFSFYMPPEHPANPNFTLKDNGGKTRTCRQIVKWVLNYFLHDPVMAHVIAVCIMSRNKHFLWVKKHYMYVPCWRHMVDGECIDYSIGRRSTSWFLCG